MRVKSRRAEHAALTRAALLDAAAELFAEKGFAATSIDDIATAARVSKGAVYHHFPDKKAIFDEVFRVVQGEVLDHVQEAAVADTGGAERPPLETAVTAVESFLSSYVTDARKRSLFRQSAGVLGVHRCRENYGELAHPLVLGLLEDLRSRGELQDVSREMAGSVIFGTLCSEPSARRPPPCPSPTTTKKPAARHPRSSPTCCRAC
ncbi:MULTISPECIES: TetR/AcrR family transcriptional regulator [Streptomyces]|uniref:TetR/AcrR family transcriptional regulator n=1 Tax=Streptomyces ramulosus TaxID=47762 RepID=A0ABW1FP64_9ACTN